LAAWYSVLEKLLIKGRPVSLIPADKLPQRQIARAKRIAREGKSFRN